LSVVIIARISVLVDYQQYSCDVSAFCGSEVLFETCVTMRFVVDDDDDGDCRNPVVGRTTAVQCWGVAAPYFTEFESLSDTK